MRVLKTREEYKCKVCGKIFKKGVFTKHLKKEHQILTLIEYAFNYDTELIIAKVCRVCKKERSLEDLLRHPTSQMCSKECDYKYKVERIRENQGNDFLKKRAEKARAARASGAFSRSQILYWINKGFSEEEALQKVSEVNRKASKRCLEYYLNKGYTSQESEKKLSEYQRKTSPRCKEYWDDKGCTEEEVLENISIFQNICSIESFISRHGILEGFFRYNNYICSLKDSNCFTVGGWVRKGHTVEQAVKKIQEIEKKAHSQIRKKRLFERSIIPILEYFGLNYESNKVIRIDDRYKGNNKYYLCLDYFISDYKLNVEMDGDYWHKDSVNEDTCRDEFLHLLGFNVFRVREGEWIQMSEEEKIKFIGGKLCELNQ